MVYMFHIDFSLSLLKNLWWVRLSRSSVRRKSRCQWEWTKSKDKLTLYMLVLPRTFHMFLGEPPAMTMPSLPSAKRKNSNSAYMTVMFMFLQRWIYKEV